MSNSNIELLYSDNEYAKNPDDSLDWYSEFNYETTCKYAYRTKIPQTRGYIYWFPNEQSTNITYTMPICIVSDEALDKNAVISVDNNEIYSIVSHAGKTDLIDGFLFDVPKYSNEIKIDNICKYEYIWRYH